MTTTVALYGRYSTDKQDATSIDGQFRNCEEFCAKHDYRIVGRYRDDGVTGTADKDRRGFVAMMEAAKRQDFDGVIVDETSRLTRTPWKLGQLVEQLQFRGQFICDAKGSFDSRLGHAQLLAGLYGGLDSMELQKIKERTHRGLRERAENGFWTGGKVYGYESVAIDADEPDSKRRLVIDPEQAEIVRWIFESYASGMSPKKIADELNRRCIPSPGASWNRTQRRANGWMHSALVGTRDRGSGILRNEIYVGKVIWNKRQFVKVPGTNKRECRMRPKDEWVIREQPKLLIIPQLLWDRVQTRLAAQRNPKSVRKRRGAPGKYILSGLLKCGDCGANFIIADRQHYRCSSHTNGGQRLCANGLRLKRSVAEEIILRGVKDDLLSPDALEYARDKAHQFLAEARRKQALAAGSESGLNSRITEIDAKLRRVIDAIEEVGISGTLVDRLRSLEGERERVQQALDALPQENSDIPDAIPEFGARWRARVADLENLPVHSGTDTAKANEALGRLLGRITLFPAGDHLEAELRLEAKRLALMASPSGPQINREILVAGA